MAYVFVSYKLWLMFVSYNWLGSAWRPSICLPCTNIFECCKKVWSFGVWKSKRLSLFKTSAQETESFILSLFLSELRRPCMRTLWGDSFMRSPSHFSIVYETHVCWIFFFFFFFFEKEDFYWNKLKRGQIGLNKR